MFFMRFAIGAIFLDHDLVVIDIARPAALEDAGRRGAKARSSSLLAVNRGSNPAVWRS